MDSPTITNKRIRFYYKDPEWARIPYLKGQINKEIRDTLRRIGVGEDLVIEVDLDSGHVEVIP